MKKKVPFTKEESKIMDLLVKAHNEFVKLESSHPSEITDWVNGIHTLQRLLGHRILRREYPSFYNTNKNFKK